MQPDGVGGCSACGGGGRRRRRGGGGPGGGLLGLLGLLAIAAVPADAAAAAARPSLEEKLRDDADLSQVYTLVERTPVAKSTLQYRHATLFAPTNEAFQDYESQEVRDDSLILYHMTNVALTLDQLGQSVPSVFEGNPPLWVSRVNASRSGGGGGRGSSSSSSSSSGTDVYVNNARVLASQSNYAATNALSKRQVLHVIDDVLQPVSLKATAPPGLQLYSPSALQFLNMSENVNVGQHRVRSFRQRVYQNGKMDVFSAAGRHTFFVPVDEGFKPPPRPEKIDQKVIDGHVIPGHVLFTRTADPTVQYPTLAFSDMMRVSISFATQVDGKTSKTYVKSNTIVGDTSHANGVVLAEIVHGNIPVSNGVVHLIHRPLMVVDNTVNQFLEEKEDGPLYKFYQVIMDMGGNFMQKITNMKELTLFAPSNAAWVDSNINKLMQDKEKLQEILNLHLVEERLPMEVIIQNNKNQLFQVPTAIEHKNLYFNVIPGRNHTLTVEGGGVNATVIQPNIAATNGIVHIIDRVLGVPYTTVRDKLATDPMLNKTYHLGQADSFNVQLGDPSKRFTYFVPRDLAWQRLEIRYPSTHKKLFMKEFTYHVKQILERHLVVAEQAFTMAQLRDRSANGTDVLPTVRDHLRIKVKEVDKRYTIEWANERVNVFRPDVECTNGIIHVIDSVLLKENDVSVTGGLGSGAGPGSVASLVNSLLMLTAAKWLLL